MSGISRPLKAQPQICGSLNQSALLPQHTPAKPAARDSFLRHHITSKPPSDVLKLTETLFSLCFSFKICTVKPLPRSRLAASRPTFLAELSPLPSEPWVKVTLVPPPRLAARGMSRSLISLFPTPIYAEAFTSEGRDVFASGQLGCLFSEFSWAG
jgi:hypothetical protein